MPRVFPSFPVVLFVLICSASAQVLPARQPNPRDRFALRMGAPFLAETSHEASSLSTSDEAASGCRAISIKYPGAYATGLTGVNNRGKVVGGWSNEATAKYGFVWDHGSFFPIAFPGSTWTVAAAINDAGDIVGTFTSAGAHVQEQGFIFSGGKYSIIDPPDSGGYAYAIDINDQGDVLGYAGQSGFLLHRGKFSYFSVPNGITYPAGLNNKGQIVGSFVDSDGRWHGFLLENGEYTTIDDPDGSATMVVDINDDGVILGVWSNDETGGIFRLENGKFEHIPDSGSFYPERTNDAGVLVGYTNTWAPSEGIIAECP